MWPEGGAALEWPRRRPAAECPPALEGPSGGCAASEPLAAGAVYNKGKEEGSVTLHITLVGSGTRGWETYSLKDRNSEVTLDTVIS